MFNKETCRICLKCRTGNTSLFDNRSGYTVLDVIELLMRSKIPQSIELPSKVCDNCIKKIDVVIEILEHCKKSEQLILSYINDKTNFIKTESLEDANFVECKPFVEILESKEIKIEPKEEKPRAVTEKSKVSPPRKNDGNPKPASSKNLSNVEHVCVYCGRVFNRHNSLVRHEKLHTGERPFICDICPRRFYRKSHLQDHIIFHIGVRKFKCEFCNRAYLKESKLRAHRNVHTLEKVFPCSFCAKKFTSRPLLTSHIRSHTGEKPFACDTCNKRYAHRTDLVVHVRSAHTGERPYVCGLCNKAFFKSYSLVIHQKIHNKTVPLEQCSSLT